MLVFMAPSDPGTRRGGLPCGGTDMRGYGKSDRPEPIDQYTIFHLVGDLIGALDALDAKSAVVVGHDVGECRMAGSANASRPRPCRRRPERALPAACKARPTSIMPRTDDANSTSSISRSPASPKPSSKAIRVDGTHLLYAGSGEGVAAARARAAAGREPGHGAKGGGFRGPGSTGDVASMA